MNLTLLATFALVPMLTVFGADPAPAPAPAAAPARRSGFVPAPRSPEVLADGRVAFRLRAPKANEVLLNGQWSTNRAALEKDTNGVWSVTVGPVEPGVWEYSFQVDGLGMIDPGNTAIKPMRAPSTSILHLPGTPPRIHDFQDVPHGTVHLHTYRSKSLQRLRDLAVYTPPGYPEAVAPFPVLYLQHGSGDNQATWTVHGKAHWILDNLIAQAKARPMVVVMMDGHAALPGPSSGGGRDNTALFESDLFEDVLPWVESQYRVQKEASGRALVGLSMGGEQALRIGLNHTDRFAWIGGFSAAAPSTNNVETALAQPEVLNRQLKLLWIACGQRDFLLQRNQDFIALLQAKGVKHEWHLTEGDHSWPVWRGYLAELAPRLFR